MVLEWMLLKPPPPEGLRIVKTFKRCERRDLWNVGLSAYFRNIISQKLRGFKGTGPEKESALILGYDEPKDSAGASLRFMVLCPEAVWSPPTSDCEDEEWLEIFTHIGLSLWTHHIHKFLYFSIKVQFIYPRSFWEIINCEKRGLFHHSCGLCARTVWRS